jgi:DNA-binding SARP family transcriptional activator/tetratricopeptide (TPR) repeat protein
MIPPAVVVTGAGVAEFRLLGTVEVVAGGQRVDLGPRKNRLILALLALEVARPISLDRLVDLVWPVSPPRTAAHAVTVAVSQLRKALRTADAGDGVELARQGDGYMLSTDPARVDAYRFRALVEQARTATDSDRIALLDRALELWRGPALDGAAPPELRLRLSRGLDEARLAAIEDRIGAKLRCGAHREVIGELTELVAAHPLREQLAGHLMLALYRAGRAGEALAVYRTLRERLATGLGLDPGPELRTLEGAILRDDPEIATPERVRAMTEAPVPAQLPPAVGGFAGRLPELAAMDAAAGGPDGSAVIIVLAGTAGVGKTSLAVQWAHRVRQRFPDGQLYVNLRGFDPSGPPLAPYDALRGFLDALGVPGNSVPADLAAQTALFRSKVSGRRILVLLDNARTADQVRPLLPGSSGCLVLVTSRTHLTGLIAAEGARPVDLDLLSPAEAGELLTRRLGARRVDAEPLARDQIVARCARLPLALAVAAARAMSRPRLPLAALAEELREARDRLDALDGDDLATNVRAVLSWSYRSLPATTARLFRLLATHPGPDVTLHTAASLAGLPLDETRTLLGELTRGNLLAEHQPGRYAFHDLLRAYASEQAHTADPLAARRAVMHRLLDHYVHSAYAADRLLAPKREPIMLASPLPRVIPFEPADQQEALAWFVAEHANLLATLADARRAGFDAAAWQLAWAISTYLDRQAHWRDWLHAFQHALAASRQVGNRKDEAYAQRVLGHAHARLHHHDDAVAHFQQALTLYAALGDPSGQASTHADKTRLLVLAGRHREAIDEMRSALELFEAAGDKSGYAQALGNLGWLQVMAGDHDAALVSSRAALDLLANLGDRFAQAATLDNIGTAHHHLRQYREAADHYRQALDRLDDLGARFEEAQVHIHLGDTLHASDSTDAARQAWQQALEILEDLGHPDAGQLRLRLEKITR